MCNIKRSSASKNGFEINSSYISFNRALKIVNKDKGTEGTNKV